MRKQVPIEQEVYKLLCDTAKKQNITPGKLANRLLDDEITRRFYKFYDGDLWTIPESTFILSALPKTQWSKLREWRRNDDQVTISAGRNGEILIVNDTKLNEWQAKQNGK